MGLEMAVLCVQVLAGGLKYCAGCFGAVFCYMSLGTTIVVGSVCVVFRCVPIVPVAVVSVGSTFIGVHTLILVLSMVCILASVWNMAVRVTGYHGFQ